jgi:iron-sulfur cluster repair protein YtfE (RIC family)
MELQRLTSRRLYEEHIHVIELLERFGFALAGLRGDPPAAGEPPWSVLLSQMAGALQHEITRHFQLEEEKLFPMLQERGEGDLAELLLEEHATIRAVAGPLLELAQRARIGDLDAAGWRMLKSHGLELVERLSSHAQKEQGALVPLVDEMLDEITDETIWNEYVS